MHSEYRDICFKHPLPFFLVFTRGGVFKVLLQKSTLVGEFWKSRNDIFKIALNQGGYSKRRGQYLNFDFIRNQWGFLIILMASIYAFLTEQLSHRTICWWNIGKSRYWNEKISQGTIKKKIGRVRYINLNPRHPIILYFSERP